MTQSYQYIQVPGYLTILEGELLHMNLMKKKWNFIVSVKKILSRISYIIILLIQFQFYPFKLSYIISTPHTSVLSIIISNTIHTYTCTGSCLEKYLQWKTTFSWYSPEYRNTIFRRVFFAKTFLQMIFLYNYTDILPSNLIYYDQNPNYKCNLMPATYMVE